MQILCKAEKKKTRKRNKAKQIKKTRSCEYMSITYFVNLYPAGTENDKSLSPV